MADVFTRLCESWARHLVESAGGSKGESGENKGKTEKS